MSDKIIGNVYETVEYEKFKILKGNRQVDHSEDIKKSIEKNGYLLSLVTVNEDFEIIDGQNTFHAAMELGLPIRYIIAEGYGIKECVAFNEESKNWKTSNYIKSYSDRGYEEYENLYELLEKYKSKIPSSVILTLSQGQMNGARYGSKMKAIKEGTYKVKCDLLQLENKLEYLAQFNISKKIRGLRDRLYVVLAFCYDFEEVDNSKLLKQWINYSYLIDGITDVMSAAEEVEKVYNFKSPQKNHVFIASEYRKEAITRSKATGKRKDICWNK